MQVRVGMSIGHSPSAAAHTPDQLQNQAVGTDQQKKDAKRRIQGSIAVGNSPDGSDEDLPPRKPSTTPTMATLAASAM